MEKVPWGQDFSFRIPILEEKISILMETLAKDGWLALISFDIQNVFEIQELYSKEIYTLILQVIQTSLLSLKGIELRKDDLIVSNISCGSKIYIFLSKAREGRRLEILDLEKIALRIQDYIYGHIFRLFYNLANYIPTIKVGYSFCFHSAHLDSKSLIQAAMEEADNLALYINHKYMLLKKSVLFDILRAQRIALDFVPFFHLSLGALVGYEIKFLPLHNELASNPVDLVRYACEAGILQEFNNLLSFQIQAEVSNINDDKYLFLPLNAFLNHEQARIIKELIANLKSKGFNAERIILGIDQLALLVHPELIQFMQTNFSDNYFYVEVNCSLPEYDFSILSNEYIRFICLTPECWQGYHKQPAQLAQLKSLINFAQSTEKLIMAVGIKSKLELELVRDLGVALASGEYFKKTEALTEGLPATNDLLIDTKMQNRLLLSIYFRRARDYFMRRDYDKAVLEFSKVIELDPLNYLAYFYRGMAFCEENILSVARKDLIKIKELNPTTPYELLLEACLEEKSANFNKAVDLYQQFLQKAELPHWDTEMLLAQQRLADLSEKQD